jgi:type I restriction enzyme S subunit
MNWMNCTIEDLCIKITDGSHFSPQEVIEGFPMFSVKDMKESGFDYSEVKKISKENYLRLVKADCQPKKDDILIAKDGSYLKHVFVCKETKNEVILSSIAILRPDIKKMDPFYFQHLLRTPSVKAMMESFVSGSALPRIVLKDFKKMKVSIPDIGTQKMVARILNAYDELIETNGQRIKLLKEAAQQLYKEWFVRMRFPGWKKAKFVKGVPRGWAVNKIEQCFEILGGGTPSTQASEYWGGGINWFTPTDITDSKEIFFFESSQQITEKGLRDSSAKLFPAYSIMMTSRATIGAIGINTKPSCTNQGFITCIPNENLPYSYLYYWLQANKETFEILASGATFLEITKGTFKKIQMPIPSKEIILQYHCLVDSLFKQIENLQQQNSHLLQIRDRLLPRLVSGKLQVKPTKNTYEINEAVSVAAQE